jgi:Putative glycosyl hydrolase domain
VVDRTLEIMNGQKDGSRVVLRPWIQDFGYGAFAPYTSAQVRAQMTAAADRDAGGWMIWNARAIFTESALGPPREGEDAGTIIIDVESAPEAPAATESPAPSDSPTPTGSP